MYQQIKEAAEAALKLQNKDAMDQALRDIVAMCDQVRPEPLIPPSKQIKSDIAATKKGAAK